MGKFAIKTTKSGVKFDLKANNGEIVASSKVYKSLVSCKNGIESVRKNSAKAGVEDQSVENATVLKHPKFVVYVDKAGEYRFMIADFSCFMYGDGEIIAYASGMEYSKENSCASAGKAKYAIMIFH